MEGVIKTHPLIAAVLVVGSGQPQSSLLIETASPPQNKLEEEKLIGEIWPVVRDANKQCPSYGRIYRNMIIFTSVDKPMLKTSKGLSSASLHWNCTPKSSIVFTSPVRIIYRPP